ncbi:MAG: CheR family methyltransferase [Polyangia bacterium]
MSRIERLAALIEERLGLLCADWQRARLLELWAARLGRRGRGSLLDEADDSEEEILLSRAELQALVDAVSINETYFFREPAHFAALVETALPARVRQGEPGRPLRLLSAGCSSGEEAYSIAITMAERCPDLLARASLYGIDLSAASVRRAQKARYSRWALRATPAELRERYFHRDGEEFQLIEPIRTTVRFEEGNLLEPDPLLPPGALDVIFCRNVLIYFSERSMRLAVARMAEMLAPGGFLFLGHSETLRGISSDFDQEHSHGTIFYRRRATVPPRLLSQATPLLFSPSGRSSPRAPSSAAAASGSSSPAAASGEVPALPAAWFESIQRSTERVAQLTSSRTPSTPSTPSAPSTPAAPTPQEPGARVATGTWGVFAPVLALIASEQPDKALELLEPMATVPAQRSIATLIRAAIVYSQSRIDEAQQASQRLIDAGAHAAEAHYLAGLCLAHKGDRERALRSFQEAVRLDPGFAMAKLRLGALQRRAGRSSEARSVLRQALAQLSHERSERLLLFGGGFRRDALLALCRAELLALGVEP